MIRHTCFTHHYIIRRISAHFSQAHHPSMWHYLFTETFVRFLTWTELGVRKQIYNWKLGRKKVLICLNFLYGHCFNLNQTIILLWSKFFNLRQSSTSAVNVSTFYRACHGFEKLNLVKLDYGGKVCGSSWFSLPTRLSQKNTTHFRSAQKWLNL